MSADKVEPWWVDPRTSDLVERLREFKFPYSKGEAELIMYEAADEIERLRAALFEIRGMCDVGSRPSIDEIGAIACRALKDEP